MVELIDHWGRFKQSLSEGFPKLGVTFLGVPMIRTIVFWGLYWGPLILGNYQVHQYVRDEGSWASHSSSDRK